MHAMVETPKAPAGSDWLLQRDDDGIAWLHLNQAQASTNVLSSRVLQALEQILDELSRTPPKGLIILSDKPSGFIAGADVREFTAIKGRDDALTAVRFGQSVFDRLQTLSFPTLALIHGHCLGGGLELALACRYRVAEENASLGLPEVRLGIHPGFGGSVRLTRLIGAPRALGLILAGRTVGARGAARLGIADVVVPQRQLLRAAHALILEAPPPHRPAAYLRVLNNTPLRQTLSWFMRRQLRSKVNPAHYPAPYAQLDVWANHGDDPESMLLAEADSISDLLPGATAQNLVRCFFLRERLKGIAKQARDVPGASHVHVVGGGAMGGDIAAWCALRGLRVTVQDPRPEAIAETMRRAGALFRRQMKIDRRVRGAFDRLIPDPRGAGIPRAEVIIEAIVESLEAKRELFRDLEKRASSSALLATNTSSIPLEAIAAGLTEPGRLVGLHFFNPVAKMPLLEVVEGKDSGADALNRARAFAGQIDKLPLPVKSSPGFLVNRILMPYLVEAVVLEGEGVPVSAIDRAATEFGMPMGPLLLADTVGLDICHSVGEVISEALGSEMPGRLNALVGTGNLGVKTGQGFYVHAGKRTPQPVESEGAVPLPQEEIQDRLFFRLVNEAKACLREGVVADADLLDAGMVFGAGFAPFRGGPMHWISSNPAGWARARLRELRARYGIRFTPDSGWS
jgi:3-hydroxyacyl-CoA dehydrogenase/enoyl-CoA hydratase/3-hydroxybutyryl-CoA epimerase